MIQLNDWSELRPLIDDLLRRPEKLGQVHEAAVDLVNTRLLVRSGGGLHGSDHCNRLMRLRDVYCCLRSDAWTASILPLSAR
jgi:hypothetical protein